jgi:hypothetical protein
MNRFFACAIAFLTAAYSADAREAACDDIDAAISASEDVAEAAIAGDAEGARKFSARLTSALTGSNLDWSPEKSRRAGERLAILKSSLESEKLAEAALASTDVYSVSVAAYEPRLPTTLDVASLDFAGFRLKALAAARNPNWEAIERSAEEAAKSFDSAAARVTDPALKDLAAEIGESLVPAAKSHKIEWLDTAADQTLAVVDLLERVVRNKSAIACK